MQKADLYIYNNLLCTLSVLQACVLYHVSHIILASSSCVYGNAGSITLIEEQPCDKPRSPYGFTKHAMEMLAYTYHNLYRIKCTCLKTFTGYGPRARPDTAAFKFMDAIHHKKPVPLFGDDQITRDFTYVGDVEHATLLAIKKPFDYEIINISGGEELTLKEFAQRIGNEIGIQPTFEYLPAKPQDQIITKASIKKAEQLLGYKPQTSFQVGIKKIYTWYQKEYIHS